jgi:hypothetical protein
VRSLLAATILCIALPLVLHGQQIVSTPAAELRVDGFGGDRPGAQLGAGINLPLGYYARLGVIGGLGAASVDDRGVLAGRVDLLARFLLDPFRQSRWGLSAAGGVSVRGNEGDRMRPHLLLLVDVEGRRTSSGVSPAFQLGLGGGVRAGVGLRWNDRASR